MNSPLLVVPALLLVISTAGGMPPTTVPSPDGDAAARHAKRTACLKEAKVRKLVGTNKAAFLKNCNTTR